MLARRADALQTTFGDGAGAGLLAVVARSEPMPVRIRSLGGFGVIRDGQPVNASAWQSRRARELLKFLVARRGRPTARTQLMEALWPDGDADRLGNRLSVALTTIRMVLDPQRRFSPGEFVDADRESVALNLGALDVDVERFLVSASEGLGHLRRGDAGTAIAALETAELTYAGDFLEENLYDDWAVPPREEARAAYIAVVRALAVHAVGDLDPDGAVRYFLRILQVDRFDEEAHLGLVAALEGAGRHGEAHRQYLRYQHAMDELDVEPVAFPIANLFPLASLRHPKPAA
jgi:DNA-binding SARP family transcriptional activator